MAKDIHAQSIPLPKFPMSAFNLGYDHKLCASFGRMNCHYVEECIPGDIAHVKTDLFVRLDPLTFPIMHKIKVRQNFFFVPDRLVLGDDLNEEFFSCKDLGAKLPRLKIPQTDQAYPYSLGKNSLFDQMGCQPALGANQYALVRNPLPFYMYQLIYKEFYADEILCAQDISDIDYIINQYRNIGLNNELQITPTQSRSPFAIRQVSYSKDRFTSAQPDAQRVGEVFVMNPLQLERIDGGSIPYNAELGTDQNGIVYVGSYGQGIQNRVRASLTIDELWDEMVVQRFLNSMNEFGNERYIEILAGQYGVLSADARLQRPQWLGGNEMVVNVSEVLQTSESTAGNPLGSFAGKGIVAGQGRDIAFRVPEHGFIIGILTFVPENGYASGSPRWLYKSSPLDFAFPRFNNLGEQAVYNGELYSDHDVDASTNDLSEFGYQPQFDEYRSHPSIVTGDFRESQLLAWHMARKFTSVPALNQSFINVDTSASNRIFNNTTPVNPLRVDAWHKAMYVRPISRHPIPGKL